jgi:hypothetical protein
MNRRGTTHRERHDDWIDPFNPASLYEDLRAGGARIQIATISGAGHGSCFVHPGFRETAIRFMTRKGL